MATATLTRERTRTAAFRPHGIPTVGYPKIADTKNDRGELNNFMNGFETALDDVNAHISGRKNLKSAWELANEL